jgi:hypothetical protein
VSYVDADGFSLGHWSDTQRQLDRHGQMRPDRRRLLEALCFDWQPRGRWRHAAIDAAIAAAALDRAGWLENFDRTLARSLRVARRRNRLSPEQISALDQIGFIWSDSEAHFVRGIAALRAYRTAGGSLPIRRAVTWQGLRLGEWVRRQREKAESGHLSEARWDALAGIVLLDRSR